MGGVMHLVLFKWKSILSTSEIKDLCSQLLSLKDDCVHPDTNKPYIVSVSGGKDNSPEGMQKGLTHGFVIEFVSAADRDYYVAKDPAHAKFGAVLLESSEDVTVLDYEIGEF